MDNQYCEILSHFQITGTPADIKPLGNGLINETLIVRTAEAHTPDYVLQRINNAVFKDVDLLQDNIERVTVHIRNKLVAAGETDIDRKVLTYIKTHNGKTYHRSPDDRYWRVMRFIPNAVTHEQVDPEHSFHAGMAFGHFETMLVDLPGTLGETIPDFHNMELRARQLQEAVAADPKGRVADVRQQLDIIAAHVDDMCRAEQLHRDGTLPKRICHCDTKVNNMMFDEQGKVLCVIDLDTVMPAFIYSDYGDFLRTAANKVAEDHPDTDAVAFDMEIFQAFTEAYIKSTQTFLTPVEREGLPYAAALFPFMQWVRFLTDYINGDVYYKIKYEEHNLVRSRNQMALFQDVLRHNTEMQQFIQRLK